jgi:hydroxyacylglutathione hydrolase
MGDPFDVKWIHGSADCAANTDPAFQVHRFDESTYILRQNKCLDFEAPFLYLLFGQNKTLLLDTGAQPAHGHVLPVRQTVQSIIHQWLASHGRQSIDLIVAHSHSHSDHTHGDAQFIGTVKRPIDCGPSGIGGVLNPFVRLPSGTSKTS